jgi:hypothetical protein
MSHVRKLIQWYNILINNNLNEFIPEEGEEDAEA